VPAPDENSVISLNLIVAFRRRQPNYWRADGFFRRIAIKIFSRTIPIGNGAIERAAIDRVARRFDDGGHLSRTPIGARFQQFSLMRRADGKHRYGQENSEALQVSSGSYSKAEEWRYRKEVQACGRYQRAKNRGTETNEPSSK
jgi:hypothetical protein